MSTTIDEDTKPAETSKHEEFRFDPKTGECTNPAKVMVPMPPGIACALLVAQRPLDGLWSAGFEIIGRKVKGAKKISPSTLSTADETRDQAVETAVVMALEYVEDDPVQSALEAFRATNYGRDRSATISQGDTPSPTAPEAKRDGAAAEFGAAAATVSPINRMIDAACGIAAALPGMAHKFGEAGCCENPGVVVLEMPRQATCSALLAMAPDGTWRCGWEGKIGDMQECVTVELESLSYGTREAALNAALTEASAWFLGFKSKRCNAASRAIEDFRERKCCANTPGEELDVKTQIPASPIYKTSFVELPVAKIQRNPQNHRKHFDAAKLRELADSIQAEGLHQPIAVRRLLPGEVPEGELPLGDPSAPEYELIFGERRWRAVQMLEGVTTITAKVYEDLPRKKASAIALIENLQRADIGCMEEAEGYAQLMEDESLTQEQAAARVGKARSTVANSLRLLKLPERVREHLREQRLTLAHGIALARFVPDEKDRVEFPKWEMILNHMADQCTSDKTPAGAIERSVPCVYSLCQAGLAVRITQWGDEKITDKLKRHPAYFAEGDGDWICFNPEHWKAELDARKAAAKEREEKERAKREAEIAAAAKKGKKQLQLSDLSRDDYREMDGAAEALLELVPEDKRAIAKDFAGRKKSVVTDVQLADRLKAAMMRAIRENRREAVKSLEEKALKKITNLKKVGPREVGWLVYVIVGGERNELSLNADAAKRAGVKLSKGAVSLEMDAQGTWDADKYEKHKAQRLAELAKSEGVDLVKALAASRLTLALADIVDNGPECPGGEFVRWWLDSDTLWLLEETDQGRSELVEKVKNAPWYARMMAGEEGES